MKQTQSLNGLLVSFKLFEVFVQKIRDGNFINIYK